MKKKYSIPSRKEDFSAWYQAVISYAELASHGKVKGTMVIEPYGYALWEKIKYELDFQIKSKMMAHNMAFPMLIPYSLFAQEGEHVEGFSPELALVTHAGGKDLSEPLVVRPTSEVIIHSYFKEKIFSWRDLPLRVNQWCSVVRWEMRPRLFLRTTEFWWQEGHTAYATQQEAKEDVMRAITMYKDFCHDSLLIPVIVGEKPEHERFAGALETWTIEGVMQDGKALQMGTSHLLSQDFAKVQGISFQGKENSQNSPFLTSWGVTTRLIGALIMSHGDDRGLVLPTKIAPYLLTIIPIYQNEDEKTAVMDAILKITSFLSSFNITFFVDDSSKTLSGKRFSSEVRGMPFLIEIGPRDIKANQIKLISRIGLNHSLFDFSLFLEKSTELFESFSLLCAAHDNKVKEIASLSYNISLLPQSASPQKGKVYTTYWCCQDYDRLPDAFSVRCFLDSEHYSSQDTACCVHGKEKCVQKLRKVLIAQAY
jgi:prolyl-tRNA synthetase